MTPETQVSGHKVNGDKKGRPWFGENQARGTKPEENQREGEEKKTKKILRLLYLPLSLAPWPK